MKTPEVQRMEDEAGEWVAAMDNGTWLDIDETRLRTWLRGDPRRSGELLRAQAGWGALDRLARAEPRGEAVEEPVRSSWRRRSVLAGGLASGLGAIAASLAATAWLIDPATRYSTRLGEIRRVPLADGSVVAINTASDIEVRYRPRRREVKVVRGEAWFQVAKNPRQPFVVEAGGVMVQAVGTAFSVRRVDQGTERGVEILVSEGTVETWAAVADGYKVRLTAGQRAFVAESAGGDLIKTSVSDVDRALAWRGGLVDLAGESLENAAGEFNRYNVRKIVIADPALAAETFDGVFQVDDPEGFARAVAVGLGASVSLDEGGRIVIAKSST